MVAARRQGLLKFWPSPWTPMGPSSVVGEGPTHELRPLSPSRNPRCKLREVGVGDEREPADNGPPWARAFGMLARRPDDGRV